MYQFRKILQEKAMNSDLLERRTIAEKWRFVNVAEPKRPKITLKH